MGLIGDKNCQYFFCFTKIYHSFSDVNGDDAYDLLAGNVSILDQAQQQQQQQSQDDNNAAAAALAADSVALKSDLTSLLNSKLQQDTSMDATRGLHFLGNDDYNAKRNLTLMLESKQMSQGSSGSDSNSGVNLFDDSFSSGSYGKTAEQQQQQQQQQGMSLFNSYTPKGDVTLASASLYGDNDKYIRSTRSGQCTPGGPTPPGSQNQTPDLSQDLNLASIQQQLQQQQHQQSQQQQVTNIFNSNSTSGGSVIAALLNSTGSSLVDTPSSLDTLSGQDSRESLRDPFLHGFTDTVTDITSDLSTSQSMDMEPLDFTFSNVDTVMTQMVPQI